MSSFTQPLTVTKLSARRWRVERAFEYHVGFEDSSEVISIPQGFITDFASVPRIFWVLFPPDGKYTQAAVVHDYLYMRHGILAEREYSRKRCDQIFLEAMKVLGVPLLTRRIMYTAVRIGGRF